MVSDHQNALLGKNPLDNVAVHIGQTKLAALIAKCQLGVVDAN